MTLGLLNEMMANDLLFSNTSNASNTNEMFFANTSNTSNTDDSNKTAIAAAATTHTNSSWTLSVLHSSLLAIGTVGLCGNLLVIVAILNYRAARKKLANLFIINQSFIDLTASLVLIANYTYSMRPAEILSNESLRDRILCKLWLSALPQWAMFMSSGYGIVLLTFERYLAIVYPLVHSVRFTMKKGAMCIVATWLIGVSYNMSYLLPAAQVMSDGSCFSMAYWPNDACKLTVAITTFLLQYVVPVTCLLTCYSRMAYTLRRRVVTNRLHNPGNIEVNNQSKDIGIGKRILTLMTPRCCKKSRLREHVNSLPNREIVVDRNNINQSGDCTPREISIATVSAMCTEFQNTKPENRTETMNLEEDTLPNRVDEIQSVPDESLSHLEEVSMNCASEKTQRRIMSDRSISEESTEFTSSSTGTGSTSASEVELSDISPSSTSAACVNMQTTASCSTDAMDPKTTNRRRSAAEQMKRMGTNSSKETGHTLSKCNIKSVAPKSKPTSLDRAHANVVKTFLTIGVCFVSCWSLNEILFFIAAFGYQLNFDGVMYNLSVFLVCLHCCINPFIYAIQYTDFQVGVKLIVKSLFSCCFKS